MMLGDMDFLNTFVYPRYCAESDLSIGLSLNSLKTSLEKNSGRDECGKNDRTLPHPISSFLMLGIFMVLMPILLMNLLIGLAVGDIEVKKRFIKDLITIGIKFDILNFMPYFLLL